MKMEFNRNFIGPSVRQVIGEHKITLLIIRDLDSMTLKASICCLISPRYQKHGLLTRTLCEKRLKSHGNLVKT